MRPKSNQIILGVILLLTAVVLAQNPCPGHPAKTTTVALPTVHQYYGNGDTRSIDREVMFPPAEETFEQIILHYTLSCPEGGCDPWDRTARVFIVAAPGQSNEQLYEIFRAITPYGVGMSVRLDVTDFRPLLSGPQTVRSEVDTWTNPGWLVEIAFEFRSGSPVHPVKAIVPLWNDTIIYGDPARPIATQMPTRQAAISDDIQGGTVRILATGHGQGNAENCAEFCAKEHTLMFNEQPSAELLWRDDCVRTAVKGQRGTWFLARAGWCPGALVEPRQVDITAQIVLGQRQSLAYEIEAYENTCRPDYQPECQDCMSFVTSCDYNGMDHTQPIWQISAYLMLW